jgi:hypothetical protein
LSVVDSLHGHGHKPGRGAGVNRERSYD